MGGGYIPMDKDLAMDSRVLALADALAQQFPQLDPTQVRQLMRDTVLGGLFRLWSHCDVYLRNDCLKCSVTTISEVTGLPASLLEKFPPEWLHIVDENTVAIPDYSVKNNLIDREKRRRQTRERVRRWRARRRANGNASRESIGNVGERHSGVTTGPDRTRTGPVVASRGGVLGPPAARPTGPDSALEGEPKSAAQVRQELERELQARFGPPNPKS